MKMMKLALLGGAALAVTTSGAFADDLSDLKAQIESLNARVAQMEAAPAVPAGYSLLTISEGKAAVIPGFEEADAASYGDKATVISVLPTADAPAATEITWSGFTRAALAYTAVQGADDDLDVWARGEIKVVGKTDTAVGEVGALVKVRGDFDGIGNAAASIPEAWGWWAMTPELTLGGGYTGSLGNIGYGYDGACNCYFTDAADVALNPGDTTQMRLSYASGPFSMAIAIEDATGAVGVGGNFRGDGNDMGVAAELKYSGDSVNGEISGVYRSISDDLHGAANEFDDAYQIGAGLGFALGDMASLSLAGAMGRVNNGQDYWGVSALASVNLSDAVHAEVAAGRKDYDAPNAVWAGFHPTDAKADVTAVLAGIYYDPVSQLTIGLEGEWINPDGGSNNSTQVDLVTVFRF